MPTNIPDLAALSVSGLGALGYATGFSDLLAVIRDAPRETSSQVAAGDILWSDLLWASEFRFENEQSSSEETRLAGEGADPNTFFVHPAKLLGTVKFPLFSPIVDNIDPVFAALWELTRLARWGTASAAVGVLIGVNDADAEDATGFTPSGVVALYTDNVSDFLPLIFPVTLSVLDTLGTSETVSVTSVNKVTRQLILAHPTNFAHAMGTTILVARPTIQGQAPYTDPAFSLLSLREGLIAPTLVSKLTLDADAESPVTVTMETMSLAIDRTVQAGLRTRKPDLLRQAASQPPRRIVQGVGVRVVPASAQAGSYGLAGALGDALFSGFQGFSIPDVLITGISITIDNALSPIYTLSSWLSGPARVRKNAYPWAIASAGRKVTGELRFRSPLEPWALAERLSGNSGLADGGLVIDYGPFKIVLSELAWSPATGVSKAEDPAVKTLKWSLVSSTGESLPALIS